jgi:hypothetical protein
VVAAEFVRVELSETQVGLRTENGTLVEVLAPATRRLYWKGQVDVAVEVIDIGARPTCRRRGGAPRADAAAPACGRGPGRRAAGAGARTRRRHPVVDGKVERLLAPARTRSGSSTATSRSKLVDLRLQAIEVTGQEILTRDKVGAAAEPVGHLALHRCAEGLHATAKPADTCTASCSSACARRWARARSTSCWRTRR